MCIRDRSATNVNLQNAVQNGSFREDLFYRLNVVQLRLPPLRERQSDLPLLVAHFVKEQNKRFETQVKGFSREAIEAMMDYDWPGNIRQLSNVVQAAMAIDSSDYIGLEVVAQLIDLPEKQPLADHSANESDYACLLYTSRCV